MNLGDGVINEGEFHFSSNSNNPILTRAQDITFTQDHILSWDNINKRAVDSGFSKEDITNIQTKSSKNESDITSLTSKVTTNTSDITAIKQKDTEQDNNISDINTKLASKLDSKPTNSDGTPALSTTNKEVVGAINELNTGLNNQVSTYNNHILDYNKHIKDFEALEGKLDQYEPLIPVKNTAFNRDFYTGSPLMDGVASSGDTSDNTVAKGTHTHPTDTSRAPVDHSSTTTNYGVGSTTKYGHVKVDDTTSTTSENPIQNKVITSYVDKKIEEIKTSTENPAQGLLEEIDRAKEAERVITANLDAEIKRATDAETALGKRIEDLDSSASLSTSETVKNITQVDGKVTVTKQSIQIGMSQVTDLSKEFTAVRSEFAEADKGLAEAYTAADGALKSDIDATQARISEVEQTVSTVKDLNSSI